MTKQECLGRIEELTSQIDALPKGYISKKVIGNRVYFYRQWSESGVKKSRYIRDGELASLSAQLEKRRELQSELEDAKAALAGLSGKSKKNYLSCTLMHKNIKVAELELDGESCAIRKAGAVYRPDHLPPGVTVKNGVPDRAELNSWWAERSIPASRSGVMEALETLQAASTGTLLVRCNGLSLSDQYWIRPEGSGLEWESINFFTNSFSEDIGDALFGSCKKDNAIDFSSPDSTSDGNLKKRWKIIDGRRCLIKGGSNPYRQQPLNEAIASEIMKRLGIPCVPYSVIWSDGVPYSVCEDFADGDTELITAWRILKTRKQPNDVSLYQHFVDCAQYLGIPDVVPFLDRMIVLDYIILNEDRHLNNYGVLRNAETLEWIGMAPIYDSGSCLGYDKTASLMRDRNEVTCKPFKNHHDEQLKLVSSFEWIDFSALEDISGIISGILSDPRASDYMDERRIGVICALAEQRVEHLKKLAESGQARQVSAYDDVRQNTAAKYV